MIPIDFQQIIHSLVERTKRGDVNWVSAASLNIGGETDDVVVSFPNYSVNVFVSSDPPGIGVVVFNSSGKRITGFNVEPDEDGYDSLRGLLDIAQRRILNVDGALAEIRDSLSRLGTVGIPKPPVLVDGDDKLPF